MMRYTFPKITSLKQVEAAIKDREEFIVAEREFGFVVNYLVNFEDTFPRMNTKDAALNELYALRRECRGIKFDANGVLIARTLHKFFNLNERAETLQENVDFEVPFVVLEKLDGSMIHPIVYQEQVALCTKMGLTDVAIPAQAFADAKGNDDILFNDFCWDMMKSGLTPTFEWCTRQQRIVVDYPDDLLILTAVRHMESGEYLSLEAMNVLADPYKVPVINEWCGAVGDVTDFVDMISNREGEEGYVFRFDGGHMLKQKNRWYVQLHKVKALLEFEKDVWALLIDEKQDDLKAVMEDDDKARIDAFAKDLFVAMNETAERLRWIVIAAKDNLNNSKKRFALEVVPQHDAQEKGLLFSIWDGAEPLDVVKDYIRKNCGTQTKVNMVRPLVGGLEWDRY